MAKKKKIAKKVTKKRTQFEVTSPVSIRNQLDKLGFYSDSNLFLNWLKTAYAEFTHRGHALFYDSYSEEYVVAEHGILRPLGNIGGADEPNRNYALGALIPGKVRTAVLNADDENTLVGSTAFPEHKLPTLSFTCLGRFYFGDAAVRVDERNKIAAMFVARELVVLDYVPDETLSLSAAAKKVLAASKKSYKKDPKAGEKAAKALAALKPPKAGFTLTNDKWHCPSTVVVHDTKLNVTYIVGQDAGVYFGCELAKPVKTVAQAYTELTPKEARGVDIQRQGEWFAVPVAANKVPTLKDIVCTFDCDDAGASLPKDDPNSASHIVLTTDGRAGKDGLVYAKNFRLIHSEDEHPALQGKQDQWYTFYKNTAVRSFNEQGVD